MCREENEIQRTQGKRWKKGIKRVKKEVYEKYILHKWYSLWENLESDCNIDISSFFFRLFVATYVKTYRKKVINRIGNFVWKTIFVLILAAGFVMGIGYVWAELFMKKQEDVEVHQIIISGIFFVLLMLICGAVAKWLDVKKFQETWVRHSMHLHLMEKEMCLFVCQMNPYDGPFRKQTFMYRIMDIWDKNQEKFCENMEMKEREMMDIFDKLKKI